MSDSLGALRARLNGFHDVAEFSRLVRSARIALGARTFMRQPGLAWLQEACSAAEFAGLRGASMVRLIDEREERPDIAILIDDVEEPYEVVEADREGRRRGDEYKGPGPAPGTAVDIADADKLTEVEVAEVVRKAAASKAGKARKLADRGNPYPPGTCLLIHVNVCPFFCDADAAMDLFPEAVKPARPWFAAIWTMWDGAARQA